jgi:hypothetical protein
MAYVPAIASSQENHQWPHFCDEPGRAAFPLKPGSARSLGSILLLRVVPVGAGTLLLLPRQLGEPFLRPLQLGDPFL